MKTQMRVQKILMLVSLIVAAITFVFGLFFLTGGLGYTSNYLITEIKDAGVTIASGEEAVGEFVELAQGYVRTYVSLAIVFIVLAALLFVTSCNKRRNYYITNYIAIGLFVAFALAMVIYIFIMVGDVKTAYVDTIKWDLVAKALEEHPEWPISKTENYQFIIGYVVAVIVIIDAVLLTLCTVWKVLLMQGEKKLLEQSAHVESASAEEVA